MAPGRARASAGRGHVVIRGIEKRFAGTLVLGRIDLECRPGEFVVVVGPSGCGKSTLLNIVAGMARADAGMVTLDGHAITAPGPERAMVFQDHGLFPWLSARANVDFGLKMRGMAGSERQDRVEEVLRMVHLSHAGHKLVHELSGGMRQRVAIARALVLDPALLLMDEPFASLDAQTRTLLHFQVQELWLAAKKTILFVTHSVGEAVRLADRIIVLAANPGRIRRVISVDLPHPRNFDSPQISEVVRQVRREIEDEVNRVNEQLGDDRWQPAAAADMDIDTIDLGGGI
ncbi:MAG: ABC transporter ATP-binding protein [Tepidisphaeraceae bacterium]